MSTSRTTLLPIVVKSAKRGTPRKKAYVSTTKTPQMTHIRLVRDVTWVFGMQANIIIIQKRFTLRYPVNRVMEHYFIPRSFLSIT